MKYIKLFDEHSQYESYTADTSGFILPNVSYCIDTPIEVHYNPLITCEVTSIYEIVGTPSYPSTVDGDITFFDILVNYRRTDTDLYCQETVTEGTDTITVEIGQNPSTSSTRVVSGTVDYHGNEIEYSVEQSKFEAKVIAKFNVTDTSNPTRIESTTTGFSAIEIDGVELPSVVSAYTFSTTGEHIVKFTLTSPTSISSYSFRNCSGLTSIDIPNSVTNIGTEAFLYCSSLESIVIPDSVTSIGGEAFYNCTSLSSCTIGSGVTSIGDFAFSICSGLKSIDIPNSVTTIGSNAFCYCKSLESINIPDSVTSIGHSAFAGCSGLTSITIPDSVTSIGSGMCSGCASLTSIGKIGSGASVEIPNSVTSICNSAFTDCGVESVDIPDSVTSIGAYAFSGCTSLTSCTIGSGVTSINNGLFQGCSVLTSIDIPDSVTSIGNTVFRECTSLSSCTIGSGVTSIGNNVFYSCGSLESIASNATTAPTVNNYTFYNIKTNGILYVPIGSSGYDTWMKYLQGWYGWRKVEQ